MTAVQIEEYNTDWTSKAYFTVSGQNSNNSVRVTNEFMSAVERDGDWALYWRTEKEKAARENRSPKPRRVLKARALWDEIAYAAWACADPGLQFDTTINEWHTCPQDGKLRASNPCVTGDTLVATSGGWRRIDQLLDSDFDVVGADGGLHPVKPAFRTGEKPVYRLRTKAGFEVKLTADHKILTANRGDVPACELTKDDVILLGNGYLRPVVATATSLAAGTRQPADGTARSHGWRWLLMGEQETAMVTLHPEEAVAGRGAREPPGVQERVRCRRLGRAIAHPCRRRRCDRHFAVRRQRTETVRG